MEEFNRFFKENRNLIFKENDDLTLFGAVVFVFFGIALVEATFRLKRNEKKKS